MWVLDSSTLHRYDLVAGTHTQILIDDASRPRAFRAPEITELAVLCDGSAIAGSRRVADALVIGACDSFASWLCIRTDGVAEDGGERMIWQPNRLRVLDAAGRLQWNAWPPLERPFLMPRAASRLDTGEWLVDEGGLQSRPPPRPNALCTAVDADFECRVWRAPGVRGESYESRAGRSGRWSWRGGSVDPTTKQIAIELVERATGRNVVMRDLGFWDPWSDDLHCAIQMSALHDPELREYEAPVESVADFVEENLPEESQQTARFDFLVSPDGTELWGIDRSRWCVVRYALPAD